MLLRPDFYVIFRELWTSYGVIPGALLWVVAELLWLESTPVLQEIAIACPQVVLEFWRRI
jgi:hypothetical protein